MKKLSILLFTIFNFTLLIAQQSTQKMSYQSVVRNSQNQLVINTQVALKVSILQGSATGSVVYTEILTPTTNANGLISTEIGNLAPFNTINWANAPYFIKTEIDLTGGTNYTIATTNQLLSVPYSLYSFKTQNFDGGLATILQNSNNANNNKILNVSQIGIGTSSPDTSAILDLTSNSKGLLMPRLTDSEMTNIANPSEGLAVYNKTIKKQCFYNGTEWVCFPQDCFSPQAAAGNDSTIIDTNFTFLNANIPYVGSGHWYVISGTGGVFENDTLYNTKFTGQYNMQYTLRWVISNPPCISSTDDVNIFFTDWICGNSLTITHTAGNVAPVSKIVNYGTVSTTLFGGTKCAITRNLGADSQATSEIDGSEAARGWYWQFNRKQGFKHDGTIRTPNTAWINSISESINWSIDNEPCKLLLGNGWRLPTNSEWNNVIINGGWTNFNSAYNSVIKLSTNSFLSNYDGHLFNEYLTTRTYYWSSIYKNQTESYSLYLINNSVSVGYYDKASGFAVRCIRD